MKHTLLLSAVLFALIATGCSSVSPYDYMDNWVIRQNAVPGYFADFDVIYIYPSTVSNSKDLILNWKKEKYAEEIFEFTRFQTSEVFGKKVRIFAPFVHQTSEQEYQKLTSSNLEGWRHTAIANGIEDTIEAIRYYLKKYHTPGRPYILLGEGQGAVDLYYAMKECTDINTQNGFVAAYLLNMPFLSEGMIVENFKSRNIKPATEEYEPGVIASWHIEFHGPAHKEKEKCYVINPLNWSTDPAAVPATSNKGAIFYSKDTKKAEWKKVFLKNFCGAAIDANTGHLTLSYSIKVSEERRNQYIKSAFGFFAENVKENAFKRVRQYIFKKQWEN